MQKLRPTPVETYDTSPCKLLPLESRVSNNVHENLFKFCKNFDRISPQQVVKHI